MRTQTVDATWRRGLIPAAEQTSSGTAQRVACSGANAAPGHECRHLRKDTEKTARHDIESSTEMGVAGRPPERVTVTK